MGLEQRVEGNFISIYKAKFAQRVREGTEGAITRLLEAGKNAGKPVWEKHYDSFTGKLIGIRNQDSAFGKQWIFTFKDNDELYHWTIGESNRFGLAFVKQLPNIDLSQEMTVSPKMTTNEKGKETASLFVKQNGQTIKHAYTQVNPNGLPPWEQITLKGVLTWDNSKQVEYLRNIVMTQIAPKLGQNKAEAKADAEFDAIGAETPQPVVEGEANPDDIPF